MTALANDILEKYQVRKTKKQKTEFLSFLEGFSKENGYEMKIEKGSLGARNAVFGNPETARVIYSAHYDTCPRLFFPNFITPLSPLLYVLYQLLITALFFSIGFASGALGNFLFGEATGPLISLLVIYLLLGLMMFGPANKHTANDNTSGVITILELMKRMPESEREKAAFILFDFEEVGLVGSSSFALKHKLTSKNILLMNFDCVSDGKDLLFCVKRTAREYADEIEEAFKSSEKFRVKVAKKGFIYPSDQANFKKGVGIAALNRTKSGILYMDKIHTDKDRVFDMDNIDFLVEGSVRLTEMM